jgi:hypothetical protein
MKKIIIGIMLMALIVTGSIGVYDISADDGIMLEYDNFDSVSSNMSISSGTATCTGKALMTANKTSEIEMTLLKDGSAYGSWSKTYTGKGTKVLEKSKSLVKGHTYRVRVVFKVYSGSTVVEASASYTTPVDY